MLVAIPTYQGVLLSTLDRFPGKCHLRAPCLGQILPSWIPRLNQSDFFRPDPAFQLLLASDGLMDIVEVFVIDQPVTMILARKPFDLATFVLKRPAVDAIRHADVKRSSGLHTM